MSVSVEKLEKSMAVLTIEVSAEDFDKAVDRVYRRERGRMNIPGFRKGKAPRKVIEKMFGESVFYEDAANECINSSYEAEASSCGEHVVSYPEIEVVQIGAGKPFIYKATVAVKPPVELGEYKGVTVTKREVSVTDEEVEAEIGRERDKNASLEEVTDRPVENGDQINLDFEGFVDGEAFEGGKGTDYPLTIGSGSFIPGFEEQLVGAKIGEEMEVSVTFPEDYGTEDLAGKAAIFKCRVNRIQVKVLPELNDEYADDFTEFATMDEYRADVRARLLADKEKAAASERENEAVEAAVEAASIEIPAPMLDYEADKMVEDWGRRLQAQGMSIDQYFQYSGMDRDRMKETLKPQAEKNIRTRLVLEEIVKAEGIEVSDEEIDAELAKMAEAYQADLDTIKKYFGEGANRESLVSDIAVQKAVSLIADNAVDVEPAAEETEDAE